MVDRPRSGEKSEAAGAPPSYVGEGVRRNPLSSRGNGDEQKEGEAGNLSVNFFLTSHFCS